ncbi:MAG: amidohydrolase family protein [Sphingomonadales bacterium]|nr:amidohydrolase family protein [Sphingomonadales bacterium]MDE2171821.1 amidohydrolase family protein [Sphingomonadales bacterium]
MVSSLASLAMGGALSAATPAMAETVVLRDFTLIDGTGHAPLAHQALVMTNGRITWVGSAAAVKVPAGATVEKLAGKYLLPGLIDSHVHLGLVDGITQDLKYQTPQSINAQLATYAAYGITSVQALGTEKDFVFSMQAAQKAGRPDRARIFTVGQGVVFKGSYGGVPGLDQKVSTPAEARRMVDAQAAKGADMIKLWVDDEFGSLPDRMPASISSAVIDEAHRDHKKAVAHIFYRDNLEELMREGINGFAHTVRDQPMSRQDIATMKAKGVWQMAATLSREASFTYATLPFLNDPFFSRGVTPQVLSELGSAQRAQKLRSSPTFPKYPQVLRLAMQNFAAEAKAGVSYGMGTDSGPSARFPGYFAHWEMELMVKAGITPMQAIVAATSSNARFIGAKDIGTVAPGKWGDLLVLDANPLTDIRNTRKISAVFIAGKPVRTIWQTCAGRPADACGRQP